MTDYETTDRSYETHRTDYETTDRSYETHRTDQETTDWSYVFQTRTVIMNHIALNSLNSIKAQLLGFSDLTESRIRDLWERTADPLFPADHPYPQNRTPSLYEKMIFRFRQAGSAATFYNGLDPSTQQWLSMRCGIYDGKRGHEALLFFSWIGNGLGPSDIDAQAISLWRKNEIRYFWSLDEARQQSLIDRYNIECIDSYNALKDA